MQAEACADYYAAIVEHKSKRYKYNGMWLYRMVVVVVAVVQQQYRTRRRQLLVRFLVSSRCCRCDAEPVHIELHVTVTTVLQTQPTANQCTTMNTVSLHIAQESIVPFTALDSSSMALFTAAARSFSPIALMAFIRASCA